MICSVDLARDFNHMERENLVDIGRKYFLKGVSGKHKLDRLTDIFVDSFRRIHHFRDSRQTQLANCIMDFDAGHLERIFILKNIKLGVS